MAFGYSITEQASRHHGGDIQKVKGVGLSMEDYHTILYKMQVCVWIIICVQDTCGALVQLGCYNHSMYPSY